MRNLLLAQAKAPGRSVFRGGRASGMDLVPPLRFGTQPMAGTKVKHQRSLQGSQQRNPAAGESRRVAVRVDSRKLTVQGRHQKNSQSLVRRTETSSQALPRSGFQYKPFVFSSHSATPPQKLTAMQKLLPRLSQFAGTKATQARTCSQRPAKKAAGATSRSWILGRKNSERGRSSRPHRTAPADGKRSRVVAKKCAGTRQTRAQSLSLGGSEWRRVFDGSVSEAQHLEYHAGCKGFCIRCDVNKRQKVYRACSPWLSPGVSRGIWGLGCIDCAKYYGTGNKLKGARFSKFAKYEVRPTSGFAARWQIEQHRQSESHRVACGVKRKELHLSAEPPRPQPLACMLGDSTDSLGEQ